MDLVLPPTADLTDAQKQEIIALVLGGLGEAELKIVASYTSPFFWTLRGDDNREMMKGGSIFFLATGERIIGVTAAHVVEECLQDTKLPTFIQCMVGGNTGFILPFSLGDRLIDAHHDIDIATLSFTPEEIKRLGREVLRGWTLSWPPSLPQLYRGVTYCGFPGNGRRWLAPKEISFGCVSMAGIVSSVSDKSISVQIEREHLTQIMGDMTMPDNYDFGGISGGLLLAIVDNGLIRAWRPAGVIYEGPNTSSIEGESIAGLEIIRARPVHFIKPNGEIDVTRWEQLHF